MPRGMSRCRICGKNVISMFRPYHEKIQCRRMRELRGDFLPELKPKEKQKKKGLLDGWLNE